MTKPALTPEVIDELLPGFVLGILEPDEALAVADYLAAQTRLQTRQLELEELLAALAMTAPEVVLSPAVKAQFLARLERAGHPAAPVTQPARQPLLERLAGLFWRPGPFALVAAGALVLVFLLSFLALNLNNRWRTSQAALDNAAAERAALVAANDALAADLAAAQTSNAALASELQALQGAFQEVRLDEEQLQVVSYATNSVNLEPHETHPGIRGFFYYGSPHEPGLLVLHGLERLPDDQVYQFWLVTPEGRQIPHELFQVEGPEAPTLETIPLDESTPEFVAVGVTIEPAGGSPQPTGVMLLQGASERNS